ncbi:ABC transporter permease [Streptobacillus moniliformis]|uniref:ABC transporter permease n=1 Tax=Streptobacillus moniliformis TaxID=34105 RepID=UPI0007E39C37|nr:ABC transporter permease [Streptobacillus moniliformis]
MIFLELKKIRRKKLMLIFIILVIISIITQYFMGSIIYNGMAYGNKLGWFFKNSLILNTYYFFIPIISLIGMELFILEERNNTLKNLLVIPINKKELMCIKIYLLFILTIIYIIITFLSMCLLELMFNSNTLSLSFSLLYFIKYLIHGIGCYIFSVFIIMAMLYFKQNIQITVAIAFILSFIGVFISQVRFAYIYFVNAMFYISGEVSSNIFEKIIATIVIFFLIFLEVKLFSIISNREEF